MMYTTPHNSYAVVPSDDGWHVRRMVGGYFPATIVASDVHSFTQAKIMACVLELRETT
jgi:hypothetical protein